MTNTEATTEAAPPSSVAVVDLAAITRNVAHLVDIAHPARVMTVVKANGYGHGPVQVAGAAVAGGASWLGVADIAEGLELREAGIDAPVLAWLHQPDADFAGAIASRIDIGVSDPGQLASVADAADAVGRGPASVHLKLDTGLGRNGADSSSWQAFFDEARRLELAGRLRVRGVFSHLSNANDHEDGLQLERFTTGLAAALDAGLRPDLRHLASTAAALRLPDTRLDLVRTGIGSYGLSPFDEQHTATHELVPAMTLRSTVVAVTPSSDSDFGARSAIVPLGYGDGIPPQAAGRIHITGDGGRLLVTRIESDHLVAEPASQGDDVARGDAVTLFGDPARGHTSADDWAAAADTINYEIVTRLGRRVPRSYTS